MVGIIVSTQQFLVRCLLEEYTLIIVRIPTLIPNFHLNLHLHPFLKYRVNNGYQNKKSYVFSGCFRAIVCLSKLNVPQIIPRPAPTPGPSQQKILVSSPSHYSSRDKITGPPILRRSSTSSSTSQDLDLPQFPRVLALRRRDGNARRMSLESDSSVPSIQIEPPTRSSSEASLATTVAGHLLPTGDVAQELDFSAPPAGYDIPNRQRSYSMHGSQYEYSRPQSRTGFRYGPTSPTASTVRPVIPGISAQNTLANNAPRK